MSYGADDYFNKFVVPTRKLLFVVFSNNVLRWSFLSVLVFIFTLYILQNIFYYLQKVVNGARVNNWVCINFCSERGFDNDAAARFCSELVRMCQNSGVVRHILIVSVMF